MLKVLSLFSGIGAFEKALSNMGVPFTLVNYCEIDKYASKAYSLIHDIPEDKNLGDITLVDTDKLEDFDLMTFGFPCQDISVAGKGAGIKEGTRSGLYYEGYRILKAKLPKYSIIENVKALISKKHKESFEMILKDLEDLGYTNYWQVLNGKDYGIPQNRERVFIISIRGEHEPYEFPLPFDNGLRLKDMLEDEVDEKYYISDEKIKGLIERLKDKNQDISYCIDSNYWKGTTPKQFLEKSRRQLVAELNKLIQVGEVDIKGNESIRRVYSPEGVSPTLTDMQGGHRQPKVVEPNYRIRKLTPKECWRLMGFDDSDIDKCINAGISNTQLYKMAGNSVMVKKLECILRKLFKGGLKCQKN
jgi:DNA (cytosine-5)-methyltransferase 1